MIDSNVKLTDNNRVQQIIINTRQYILVTSISDSNGRIVTRKKLIDTSKGQKVKRERVTTEKRQAVKKVIGGTCATVKKPSKKIKLTNGKVYTRRIGSSVTFAKNLKNGVAIPSYTIPTYNHIFGK